MEPQLKSLPIDQLITDGNIRHDYGDLLALAGTFVDGQPDTPPVVHRNQRGYIVEEGNRRVEAAKLIGTKILWCVVKPAPPDNPKMRQLIADFHHKSLTPLERAEALQAITAEAPDLTQARLGEVLGISQTEVCQTLGLLNLCPEAQEAIREEFIGMGIAELLMPLDCKIQERVLPEILRRKGPRTGKPTVAQARRAISEATMTEEDRKAREDASLAAALGRIAAEPNHVPDTFDKLLDAGEPAQAVHFLYYMIQAEYEIGRCRETYSLEGASADLRKRINDLASRLSEEAQKIKEMT